jgi:uncharacterized protein
MTATNGASARSGAAMIFGVFFCVAIALGAWLLGRAALEVKALERTVTVKGLSEREYPADLVLWPIMFTAASNNLVSLYEEIERTTATLRRFLEQRGIAADSITVGAPAVTDKSIHSYGGGQPAEFRYSATQTVTVYSGDVERVRLLSGDLAELGKQGIAFAGEGWQTQTEYMFSRLNDVKPEMIEEATRKAREVALKFAEDSNSRLGKIRTASQGQFTIADRDRNNPHIKQVRVVSTVEYYLAD